MNATWFTGTEADALQGTSIPLLVKGLSNVTAQYGGAYATCAVTASHQWMCWGSNSDGMLAAGDANVGVNDVVPVPTAVQGLCA